MNILRTVGLIVLALVVAVIALKIFAIVTTFLFTLLSLVVLAGVLFLVFTLVRSTMGKRASS